MKKTQIVIFLLLVATLFALNSIFLSLDNFEVSEMPEMVDHDQISSQKLFDNCWKLIRDNYYDAELNNQAWGRWKEHYHGQIKTDEDAKVAIRNIRRDANDMVKKQQKANEISEDEQKTAEESIQKMTDEFVAKIDKMVEAKSKEIMTV